MEWILIAAVIAGVLGARAIWRKAGELTPQAKQDVRPERSSDDSPTKVIVPLPESAIDLTTSDGIKSQIAGTSYWVESTDLRRFNGTVFYLRREPSNRHDPNAIAVYGGTRKVGYVSASQAEKYAPLLDQLGTEFVVTRDSDFYAGDEFFLPRIPALRKLLVSGAQVFDRSKNLTLAEPKRPLTDPPGALTGGHPRTGGPHRNGDRIYGFSTGHSQEMTEAGTPTISALTRGSIQAKVSEVRIGDRLPIVQRDGKLWVEKDGEPVGRLNWTWDHLSGVMEVQRVFISKENQIVNCAGIGVPDK